MNYENLPGREKKSLSPSSIDYSPKTYTVGEQILFSIKLFAIGGAVFFFFWLVEKLHLYY
ncbi:MAG: hypothetical protein KKC20_12095 [Proteobacteria bacterium]|nr:hypothetical protein [Pseudomonadota bacterium]